MKTKTKYQTKKRKTQRQRRVELILMTAFIIGVGIIGYSIKQVEADIKPTEIAIYKQKEKVKEPSMREWVLNRFKEEGLNVSLIECIIQNESGWDNWKYNINTNGSTDMGLFQINSIHKKTASVECRWDYKCSTEWAIKKIKRDGNYSAWYGIKNCLNLINI